VEEVSVCYEDVVMDELEERLSFEDIDEYCEKINRLIEQEKRKEEDAMRPEILAETVKSYIFEGMWYDDADCLTDEMDEFEMEQQYCC
jgi:hypothetical protein